MCSLCIGAALEKLSSGEATVQAQVQTIEPFTPLVAGTVILPANAQALLLDAGLGYSIANAGIATESATAMVSRIDNIFFPICQFLQKYSSLFSSGVGVLRRPVSGRFSAALFSHNAVKRLFSCSCWRQFPSTGPALTNGKAVLLLAFVIQGPPSLIILRVRFPRLGGRFAALIGN